MAAVLCVGLPRPAVAAQECWDGCSCEFATFEGHYVYFINCLNSCEQIRSWECETNIGLFCWLQFGTVDGACWGTSCIAMCDLGIIQ